MNDVGAVAAAQTIPLKGEVDANTAQHARLIEVAANTGIDALLFPEMSLTGYELGLAADLAFEEHDARLTPLRDLACEHAMTLVVGAPVRADGRLSIGAFVLTPTGEVALYTKRFLGAGEGVFIEPGNRDPLVGLGSGSAAIAVCADASHPEHVRAASDRGVDVYLASSFTNPHQIEQKLATLEGYAAAYRLAVAFANYGGPTGEEPSAGRSTVWSPDGLELAQLPSGGLGLVVATLEQGRWTGRAVEMPDPSP